MRSRGSMTSESRASARGPCPGPDQRPSVPSPMRSPLRSRPLRRGSRTMACPGLAVDSGECPIRAAGDARRADVAERAVGAGEVLRRRRVVPRPHPGGGRRDLVAGLGQPLRVDRDLADQPRFEEVQRDRVGQPAGHRLVAHRVDLELERVAGALPGLGRVAHVGRLVVGDGHALRPEHPEGRRDDVGARPSVDDAAWPARSPPRAGTTSTRSHRPRTRSPPRLKLNSRST